jgi:hypothetical protein
MQSMKQSLQLVMAPIADELIATIEQTVPPYCNIFINE